MRLPFAHPALPAKKEIRSPEVLGSVLLVAPRDSLILKNHEDMPIMGDVPHNIPHTRKSYLGIMEKTWAWPTWKTPAAVKPENRAGIKQIAQLIE
jgi:hypothetical protein